MTKKELEQKAEEYLKNTPPCNYHITRKAYLDGLVEGNANMGDWIYICDKGYPKDQEKYYLWAVLRNNGTIMQMVETTKGVLRLFNMYVEDYNTVPSYSIYAYKELGEIPPFRTVEVKK